MQLRKQILLCAALLLLFPASVFATAFGASTQWNAVSGSGSDTNGGAFDKGVGSPGTDESTGAGTSVSCVVQSTTTNAICTPAITSTTHGPGNFIGPMTGTGCTGSQFVELLSQSGGTGTFNVSLGTAASVCVGTMGGPLATIAKEASLAVANNILWCSGTFTFTSTLNASNVSPISFVGYTTTRGDGGRCSWTTSTNSISLVTTNTSSGIYIWDNISFSTTAGTPADGVQQISNHSTATWAFINDKFSGFTTAMDSSDTVTTYDVYYVFVLFTEVSGGANGLVTNQNTPLWINGSYFHGQSSYSVESKNGSVYAYNSVFSSSFYGIVFGSNNFGQVLFCTFYNNSSYGLDVVGGFNGTVWGNIFYGNAYGIYGNTSYPSYTMSGNNAFGNSGTGDVANWTKSPSDVTLTSNPFVSASTGNFALNTTAGGGALLVGLAMPTTFGSATTNLMNFGAVQSSGSGGGSTVVGNYGTVN